MKQNLLMLLLMVVYPVICWAKEEVVVAPTTPDTTEVMADAPQQELNTPTRPTFMDSIVNSYHASITIEKPIEIVHDINGYVEAPCTGSVKITFYPDSSISEIVEASMSPYNAIMLTYHTMGKSYTGYYN